MNNNIRDLVKRFIEGDQKAFAELVRRFNKRVYSVAYQMLGNHLDADEVTQEAFVRIYNRRENLKNIDYFASFLMRIATNYAIDLIRWKQKGFVSIDDDQSVPGAVSLELTDDTLGADKILENLSSFTTLRATPKKRLPIFCSVLKRR